MEAHNQKEGKTEEQPVWVDSREALSGMLFPEEGEFLSAYREVITGNPEGSDYGKVSD